jgi:Serine incorporator (Serinc)
MIQVKTSKDFRAKIQNGFWGFKLVILAGLVVAAFFIPNDGFARAFMVIGLIGGFMVNVYSIKKYIYSFVYFSLFLSNYFYQLILFIRKF